MKRCPCSFPTNTLPALKAPLNSRSSSPSDPSYSAGQAAGLTGVKIRSSSVGWTGWWKQKTRCWFLLEPLRPLCNRIKAAWTEEIFLEIGSGSAQRKVCGKYGETATGEKEAGGSEGRILSPPCVAHVKAATHLSHVGGLNRDDPAHSATVKSFLAPKLCYTSPAC